MIARFHSFLAGQRKRQRWDPFWFRLNLMREIVELARSAPREHGTDARGPRSLRNMEGSKVKFAAVLRIYECESESQTTRPTRRSFEHTA